MLKTGLIPLRHAAMKYKISAAWLERETRAGRLPGLIADTTILFDERKLVEALKRRMKENNNGN